MSVKKQVLDILKENGKCDLYFICEQMDQQWTYNELLKYLNNFEQQGLIEFCGSNTWKLPTDN